MLQTGRKAKTGIIGLDDILGGGLPRNRTYLVKGQPGTGKTTLALEFLLSGAEHGEVGLYITLSETEEELRAVAESHAWDLSKIHIFELKMRDPLKDDYTMYHPAEVELGEAMQTLFAQIERTRASRIVFDSLSEIRLLAQQPLRYRREILNLKQNLAGRDCTVLLLDDHSMGESHLESLAHGVISLERSSPGYGSSRRRLEIAKLRGVKYRDGFHDFSIHPGGLRVFPRLRTSDGATRFDRGSLESGVPSLDELLCGGVDRGTSTLLIGPAGSGKSALATQYAVAAASAGERAVIYAFDESLNTALARADSLSMPLRRYVEAGLVRMSEIDPAETSAGELMDSVRRAVDDDGARMVIIDSLTGYLNALPEEHLLLSQLHELLTYLGQRGVVTILIATQHGVIGTAMATPVDVSYLADTVVLLRYFEAGGRVRNAISVVKKRSGRHERTIREYALGLGGIQIGVPLHDFHGVLTGIPTYTGQSEPLLDVAGARRS